MQVLMAFISIISAAFIRSKRMRSGQKWWEKMDLDFSSVQGLSTYLCVRVCVWEGVKKKANDRKKELVCCQTVDRTTWDSYSPAGHKSQLRLIKKAEGLKDGKINEELQSLLFTSSHPHHGFNPPARAHSYLCASPHRVQQGSSGY